MKAVQILGDKSTPTITTTTTHPKPLPKDTQIQIKVHAAGITGDEITWPEVYALPSRIPGHDISGTITALGPNYKGSLSVGQSVFAFLAADIGEGQAEFVVCEEEELALKPKSVGHDAAAALPIPMLTAWEALVDHHGGLKKGGRVLVTGASGAVGVCFIQLAVELFGAHVVALASERNHEMLRDLGAKETLDYRDPEWYKSVKDVDLVFDTVGGDVLKKCWETVKEKGGIITVGDPAPTWAFGGGRPEEAVRFPEVRYLHFIVSPSKARLGEAARLIDDGVVKPLPVKTFPFEEAVEAWECARKRGRGYKVVIEFYRGDVN